MAKKVLKKPTRSASSPVVKPKAPAKGNGAVSPAEIQRVDREILKLINRRAELTAKQIQAEPNPAKALFTPAADDQLADLLEKENPGPLSKEVIRAVFREVVAGGKQLVKVLRVAYLGPENSFSHIAAVERFGSQCRLIPTTSIAGAFEELNRANADYAVVPLENSTDGGIVDTLEMFTRLPLKICGEVQLRIHHHLMSRSPRGEITEVYSKPQALSQCRTWLARNMAHAQLREVTSTSTAAQIARNTPGAAAVASRQAAIQYELQIVAESIEDNPHNVTRFAIIGDEATKPTSKDKTSLLVQIQHQPGTLAELLMLFKKANINLTWIESFPLRGPEQGYLFFLDCEGHASQSGLQKLLAELGKRAARLEVLGSYPQTKPIG